ncbi:hypothetical protein [Arenibacter sp. F26102]|uniref:hypothetical protein n=1 Tax=Arenibacter sp. F26102 TaxID=2926416 RepID=UPI001FF0EAD1|nr:hypothetical protein [Arenibacter sp. F26102]
MNEKHIIEFKDGNTLDFRYFFKKYSHRIYGFTKDFIEEGDFKVVTQKTFINYWNFRNYLLEESTVQSYWFRTGRNACFNLNRYKGVHAKYASHDIQGREIHINSDILNSIESNKLSFSELPDLYKNFISELANRCTEVFIKMRFENMRNEQMANQLAITKKAVESNMTRANKILSFRLVGY